MVEREKNTTALIAIMYIAYIILWSCNNGNAIILYGGYMLLVIGLILKLLMAYPRTTIIFPKPCKFLSYFLLFSAASALWALDRDDVLSLLVLLTSSIVMTVLMSDYIIKKENSTIMLYGISAIGIAMAIYVIFTYGGLANFYQTATAANAVRIGGDINNVNIIGMQCAYSFVTLFYFGLFKKKRMCYLIMVIPFIVTAASGSRKSFLMLILGVLLLLYFYQAREKTVKKYLKVLIGIFIILASFSYILSLDIMSGIMKRTESFFAIFESNNTTKVDNSSQLRAQLIIEGIKHFFDAPVLGVGLKNSHIINAIYVGFDSYSHSDYVEHLVNGGLVGFLLYYYPVFWVFKNYVKLIRIDKDDKLIISFIILILFLIMNFACVTYYYCEETYVFWILWISQIELKKRELNLKWK